MAARRNATAPGSTGPTSTGPTSTGPTSTGAGVLRPDELARHVRLERAACDPALEPWVENHWSLRWQLPDGATYLSSTLPHPACTLSIERGHRRPEVAGDPVLVTGVPTRRFDVSIGGTGWVHGVKFRPGGLASLAGIGARELRDATVPASRVLPEPAVERLRALGPETGVEETAAVVDGVLTGLASEPEPDYLLVLDVVATMLADRSLVRVAEVERRCGVGARALQRLFERYVGVSPKWVLSRYRMHDVVTTLDQGYDGSLAELAASHGWFDQAHFTREFTDVVGVPPRTYQRSGR